MKQGSSLSWMDSPYLSQGMGYLHPFLEIQGKRIVFSIITTSVRCI